MVVLSRFYAKGAAFVLLAFPFLIELVSVEFET